MDPLPTIVFAYAADCYTWDLISFNLPNILPFTWSIAFWLFLKEAYWLNQEKQMSLNLSYFLKWYLYSTLLQYH
jgi:hypothetical protein